MLTYNDETKARSPLSLDGRGVRGEGVFLILSSFIFALLSAAPAAQADDECGLQTLPGTAETVTCNPGDYAGGITYSSLGDLTLEVPDDTVDLTVNTDGVEVTGNLADSVFWDSSTFASGDIVGTGGAVLDYSSGSGDIGIDIGGDVRAQDDATHAIQAISDSGNVTISTGGEVSGADDFGIQAQTGGSGTLNITAFGSVNGGVAAIDATTGTGLLTIDVDGSGSGSIFSSGGSTIRTNTGGDAQINIDRGVATSGSGTTLDLTAAGTTTVNVSGSGGLSNAGSDDVTAIKAAGEGGLVVSNDNTISGQLNFTDLSGGYTFNNNAGATWNVGTNSDLGSGTFNNAGTITLQFREVVFARESTFAGSGDSLLEMSVTLNGTPQTSCSNITIASCLDLSGGSTSGQTEILVTLVAPPLDPAGDLTSAANAGVLLVDVSGGTSAAEHFVLDPGSQNYLDTSFYGGVIGTGGPLVYSLLYNPSTQQHVLSTVPTEEGAEYATFIDETLSIWHTTADAVVGRQADLRGGATGGGWVRLVSERTTRDAGLAMTTHGNDFTFDVGYDQDTRAALFGFDALNRDNVVIGLHGGLISSETDYDGSGNDNEAKGAAAGIYGGWWRAIGIGQLTVDATVNTNFLKLDHDASYEVTHSDIRSLGVRAEAGWKVPVIDGFYVQPLATFAYVRSDIETMELRQNNVSFEDAESQRVALGVRLGGDFEAQSGLTARYWLTGRAWDESAEDGRVEYATTGEPLVIADDISGSFEELGFGASLSNKEDSLSVFASGSTKFIDDVTNYNFSVGLRKRW